MKKTAARRRKEAKTTIVTRLFLRHKSKSPRRRKDARQLGSAFTFLAVWGEKTSSISRLIVAPPEETQLRGFQIQKKSSVETRGYGKGRPQTKGLLGEGTFAHIFKERERNVGRLISGVGPYAGLWSLLRRDAQSKWTAVKKGKERESGI